jgi:uncharacterized membrane protein
VAEVSYAEELAVEAPAEKLYAYRLDFENLPDYNPNVSNLRRTDEGTVPGPGATYEFDVAMPEMGGTIANELRVLEAEEATRIVNETLSGPFRALEVVTFAAIEGSTVVRFDVTVTMPDDMAAVIPVAEQTGREQVRLELEHMTKFLAGSS